MEYGGVYWVQDKSIPFQSYRATPLKRLGKDKYALYSGTEASHYIDGKHVGTNKKFVPALAAQHHDPGDVRGILTEDIGSNMDREGKPRKQ